MDHKNVVHESEMKTSQCVMRWRLLLEEYGPEIVYIKGKANIHARGKSFLTMDQSSRKTSCHY